MAGKETRSMHGYVLDKNPGQIPARPVKAPGGDAGLNDLKFEPPKTKAAPNSGQTRSNGRHRHKSAEAGINLPAAKQGPSAEKAFYDTDASSIGASSTVESPRNKIARVVCDLQNDRTNDHASRCEALSSADGSEGESGDEEGDEEDDEGPKDRLNGHQLQLMAQADYIIRLQKDNRGATMPYLKGDSYPETTSGNPSTADSIEMKTHEKKSQAAAQAQLQSRQATSMRRSLNAPNAQNQIDSRSDYARDDRDEDGLFIRPYTGDAGALEYQIKNKFAYGNATKAQIAMHPSAKPRQQLPTEAVTDEVPVSKNTATQATVSPTTGKFDPGTQLAQDKTQASDQRAQPQQHHQHGKKSRKERRVVTRGEQPLTSPVWGPDEVSDGDDHVQEDHSADARSLRHVEKPEEPLLDYDEDDLVKMDYHELKAESFDVDPNAKSVELPFDETSTNLNSKIDAVAGLESQQQVEFFTSLSITEWEQAGDWFITRFGNVLNKLKANRQEKREAAKIFEDEIEKRHETIKSKRKQTEDELSEMKESGGKVLQGTPKKPRTR